MPYSADHWIDHAAQWQRFGHPLRPCPQDVQFYEHSIRDFTTKAANCHPLRAVLMGVTPEIVLMQWPPGAQIIAIDRCKTMISAVWPAKTNSSARVVLGDWRNIPLATSAFRIVLGDGCFTSLSYPDEYHLIARNLQRILSPGGKAILRVFVRPDENEGVEPVLSDLRSGRIGSFHACKLRLAMALHGPTAGDGVGLDEVWKAWSETGRKALERSGSQRWPPDVLATIDSYRGTPGRYTFPTLAEFLQAFADAFEEEACHFGGYELAERCPLLVLRRKQG
jgi:SAM-dependent methyltransferase